MRRRDFTVNAMARRLATGELVDPLNGERDLERARAAHGVADELRGGSAAARARAALRVAARLRPRRVDPPADARRGRVGDARLGRAHRRRDSAPTGWASSRSCCSARSPRRRSASRATPACSSSCCRSSSRDRLRPGEPLPLADASTSTRSRSSRPRRTRATRCPVRLAAVFHDLGQATRRVARDGRAAALLREARLLQTGVTSRSAASSRGRRCCGCAIRTRCATASFGSSATTCSRSGRATRCARDGFSRSTETSSRCSSSTTRTPTIAASPRRGSRPACRGSREARALPRSGSWPSARSRTALRISRSTAAI